MTESKTKCLAQTISDLLDEHQYFTSKQIVGKAYSRCGTKKEDFAEDFCPYHLLAKERFSKKFLSHLPTDFTSIPKSVMISKAVNLALPMLAKQFTESSDVDLLKMAYQLAQDSLSVNDFETIEEHPVYFAIQIPGEQMALFEAELRTAASYLNDDFTEDGRRSDADLLAALEEATIALQNAKTREVGLRALELHDQIFVELQRRLASSDFTSDNLYKIHPFKLSDVHPSVRFRKDDLEEEKLRFFERVLDKDPKNLAPILIDGDGMIWDGHHRYYALKRLKEKQIFAVQLPTHLLKKLEDFTIMGEWDYNKEANFNITNFDTKLNRLLNTLADFTYDGSISINFRGYDVKIELRMNKAIIHHPKAMPDNIESKLILHVEDQLPELTVSIGSFITQRDFTEDAAFFGPDTNVSSSNVAEVGYDRNKLRILFNNGGGYEYDVPSSFFNSMMSAPSKGAFVWEHLRGKTPGRVIDNPSKITPGGVGGSLVPYFKTRKAQMSQAQMASSVRTFLKAAQRGTAKVSGEPIQQIDKPTFKAFDAFAQTFQTPEERMKQFSSRFIPPKTKKKTKPKKFKTPKKPSSSKSESKKEEKEQVSGEIQALRRKLKRLRHMLKKAQKSGQTGLIKSLQSQIKRVERQIERTQDFTHYYTNDFMEDMRYFRGPISRAGPFDYGDIIKYKNIENLSDQAHNTHHLPVFDSHDEDHIIGFTYNLTDDPEMYMKDHQDYDSFKDEPYIYGEGYLLDEIEQYSNLNIKKDETKLPVSIKFEDANEGSGNADQQITSLVHLAMSVNATEQDRCSTVNGKSCWVSFTTDFIPKEELNMPPKGKEKKKGKEEKDDPSDKQDEEGKDNSDLSDDPKETDEEQSLESTGKHDKGDMVKISKEEYAKLQDMKKDADQTFADLKVDFKKALKDEMADFKKEVQQNQDFKQLKVDFNDEDKIYKIKADFKKTASYEDMAVLKKALVEHEEDFDPAENLGFGSSRTSKRPQSDFAKKVDATRSDKRKSWGMGY